VDRDALFSLYRRHVNAGKVDMYERYGFDAVMGRREGSRFWDAFDDRAWFDCHGNGGVFNLGHRHPAILAALDEALGHLDIGNHHLVSSTRARLAQRLAATTDDVLEGVVFGVSGGEAVDTAIKVVRAATGRRRIVSVAGGYHGHTGLAVAAGDPAYREPFHASSPDFVQVPFDDVAAMERAVDATTAAVIVEPVPATLGMPVPDPGYLPALRTITDRVGAKLIVDEVQTGLGRTGRMWAYRHWIERPDAVVTGKGLSGGLYPITATLMTRELHKVFDEHPFAHISTFGGAEPGCIVALAVLDVVEAPGFLERVRDLGARFETAFADLPFELRRLGMMMGFAFPGDGAGMLAAKLLFDRGIFAVYANNDTSVLQFLPPLTVTDDEVEAVIDIVRSTFG